jgi:protein-S-isoprenylcysteine O-methyltransferase Ste14
MTTDFLASVALGALGLYGLVAIAGRSLLQWRRTGSTGWRGVHGRPGSAAWWAGVMMALALVGLVLAPVVAIVSQPSPVGSVGLVRIVLGAASFVAGFVLTVSAQLAMGDAWRIGVQEGERTELATRGPFAWCRNPIFTGMLLAGLGMVAFVPLAAPAWLALWAGLELQVRVVEEPHLLRIHGASYQAYAARTGRFWPGLGRRLGVGPVG